MSILFQLNYIYKISTFKEASNYNEIESLEKYSSITLPQDFIEIIKEKTEIEINISNKKYIRIWGANGCIEMNVAYKIQKFIPCSLAIADDEECNVVIYATGKNGFGLYVVSISDLEIDEMIYVSQSLADLLVHGEGIDTIIKC